MSWDERQQRTAEKTKAALLFLHKTIYSSVENIGIAMKVTSKAAIYSQLKRMERAGLVASKSFPFWGGHRVLWGITEHGQHVVSQDFGVPYRSKGIERISIATGRLKHNLAVQNLFARAEGKAFTDWEFQDYGPAYKEAFNSKKYAKARSRKEQLHRPDAIATSMRNGRRVAIECELTLKAAGRYRSHVIPAHKARIQAGDYVAVIFVAENERRAKLLKEILGEEGIFIFSDLQNWPSRTPGTFKPKMAPQLQSVQATEIAPKLSDADHELRSRILAQEED